MDKLIFEVILLKKRYWVNYILLLLIALMSVNYFTGCSQRSAKPAPEEADKKKNKAPESLKELESEIESIIKELDKKEEDKKEETQVKIESKTEVKQEQDQNKGENETKQETKEEVKKESVEDKKWKTVKEKVESIHKHWNNLQPAVVKAGMQKKVIDDFSNALNILTIYAEAKDQQNTLFTANELHQFMAAFLEKFDEKIPPDVKRIGYFIRDAKYNGTANQWEKAKGSMSKAKSHWAVVKPQLKKEQETQGSKMEFALYELEKVIEQSNITLTKLKSDIVLEDLKKLEESFEKK